MWEGNITGENKWTDESSSLAQGYCSGQKPSWFNTFTAAGREEIQRCRGSWTRLGLCSLPGMCNCVLFKRNLDTHLPRKSLLVTPGGFSCVFLLINPKPLIWRSATSDLEAMVLSQKRLRYLRGQTLSLVGQFEYLGLWFLSDGKKRLTKVSNCNDTRRRSLGARVKEQGQPW